MKTTLYIKLILFVACQFVVLGNSYFAQGDDPCTATSLTVNTTCSYTNYNYANTATASTGIPAPGCASYPAGGDDVWFSAVVPASGVLIVDMNTSGSGPTDMGMAFYSASSCAGPFTLIECDDDDSNNGTMPYINRPGLTPGSTVYIRVWEYGADSYGAFRICASTSTATSCIGSNNSSCSVADPFCTGTAYNYCNTTGVASTGGYSCLISTPNPMWMYLNIQTSGAIDILIEQFTTTGTPIDVDFALYGPYTGISAACAAINGSTSTVDCSYSSAATETANITSAVAGQWYMLLITNYNGAAGYIEFTQTGGSGATNCNIVNPSCLITGVTATPSACNASNQYSVSGAVSFTNPPASGTMTVTSSCGGTQTFNAPFTSPLNYNLTGITPTGASCTVTASFSALSCSQTQTYTAPAIPTVNAGVDQTVCASTAVTLSGSGASTYSWTGGVTNGTSFTPSSTTTYTVTGTNAQGCKNTDQVLVTVNPLPTTNAGADATICAGASTTLSATGATSYSWSPSTGLSATSGTSVSATPSATTTYTVTGTTGTCTATDQVVVTVTPLPTINAGTDQTICNGASGTLTATGGTTYSWSPSTSLSATTGASVTSTATSTITYTVTGTSSGCTNTDQVVVNVNPVATANANVDQSVCAGGTVTLAGSVGGSATTGTWSASSGSFSNTNSLTSTYTPSITSGTVTLTLTSNDPAGPCPAVTDQMVVTVNSLPTPNAGTDVSYCVGGSTILTASGGSTFSWSPSTALNTTSGATVTANPTSTTTYTVTATSSSGCTATDGVVVTVNTLPIVNAGADQTLCQGPNVTLAATGASTYSWTGGITNGTAFVPSIGTTTYTVTGTDANGCTNTDEVIVTINPLPVVIANDVSVCAANTVAVTASGASTYSWSPATSLSSTSGSSVTFTPGSTTTYTVTGTSTAGCTSTDQVTVSVIANAPINAGADVSICTGGSTALNATGGTTYSWNNGLGTGNGFSVSPASTTTYTVIGTDAAGCQGTDAVTVTVNPVPVVNAGTDQTVCAGVSVTLTGSGATTYSWDQGVTNGASFVPASTQTYTVTGTSLGCTATDLVTVTVNPLPVITANDASVCPSGTVTVSAIGANTYTWSPATALSSTTGSSVTFTPGSTTTYTVTGTSAAGCTSTDLVTVSVLSSAPVNAGADVTLCAGASTTLTATGGSTYSWNNGLGSGNGFSVTPAITTTYTVTGTDVSGCTGTDQVVVTVNPIPVVSAGTDQSVCAGGSITLSGLGATSYSWDQGVSNGVSFVPASTLTYTVTGTSLGCTATDQVTVTVNALPLTNAGVDQTVCAGTSVTLNGSGANTYSWSGGVSDGVSFTPTTTATYTLTGTTLAGCTTTDLVTVTVNALPIVNAGTDQSVCDGSTVTLAGSGASTYSWNNGVTNGVSFTPVVGSQTYTVTGTSAAGCTATDQVVVTVNPNPTPVIQGPTTYCTGNFAVLSTSGTYTTYSWSNGSTTATINATTADNPISVTVTNSFGCPATSATFTVSENSVITANFTTTICQGESALIHGVSQSVADVYSQTFTSVSGCDSVANVTLVVNPLPSVNAGIDQSFCDGLSTSLTATGASTYSWNNGITNGVTFTPAVGSVTYTVTGTSAAGCTATDQVVVTVNALPLISAGIDQSICQGASVTLNGAGGTTYTWNNGVSNGVAFAPAVTTTYTVTGTDVNGCTGTDQVQVTVNSLPVVGAGTDQALCAGTQVTLAGSGASSYTWDNSVTNGIAFTPAATQTYTVTGTDVNGCTGTDQVLVTVNAIPSVGAGADQSVCPGTTVTLSGTGASTYSWDNGITNGVPFNPVTGTIVYTVTGTSSAGCTSTDQVSITVFPSAVINAGVDQSVCLGISATLTATGGVSYSWDNGLGTGNGFTVSPLVNTNYTVTGTDANGCIGSDQVLVSTNALPVLSAGIDQAVCSGGQVTLTGSGASTYTWDNSVSNGLAFTPATTQTYTVTGTDVNGCTGTDQVVVTVNAIPTVGAGADQSVCPGTIVILSGSGAATYTWNNGVSNGVGFVPGVGTVTYTVTGTSAAGCSATDQVTVVVNPNPVVSAGTDQTVCFGEQVTLSGSGASIYSWTNSISDGVSFTPSSTNTYTVTGTDVNGCTGTDQVIVTVNPIPVVSAGNDLSICEGSGMTLTGSGANTYSWDNGVQNGVTFNPSVGTTTYTVTGTTSANCTGTDQVNITVNALPIVSFDSDVTQGCLPLQVSLTNSSSNSSECVWTLSDGTVLLGCGSVSHWFTSSGCFDVTLSITDNNGCVSSSTSNDLVCVEAPPVASFEPSANEVATYDTEIFFDNTTYGASTYEWVFGDPEGSNYSTEEDPSHTYPNIGGEYDVLLTAYSPLGCTDTAWAKIIVKEDLVFYVPNTFTPDNDGYNEEFKPVFTAGFNPYEYDFFIFNRWGQIVFESHNSEVGWNGSYGSNQEIKLVQDGTYTWLIRYRLTEGNGYRKVTGHVNVIR
jgi:gliding motility-associated-like protein